MTFVDRSSHWRTGLIVAAAVLALAVIVGLAQRPSDGPHSVWDWMLVGAVTVATWLALEVVGALLGNLVEREPVGRWVLRRTADKSFSSLRVLYLLARSLILIGCIGLAIWLLSS
jgi:hypothetical protein